MVARALLGPCDVRALSGKGCVHPSRTHAAICRIGVPLPSLGHPRDQRVPRGVGHNLRQVGGGRPTVGAHAAGELGQLPCRREEDEPPAGAVRRASPQVNPRQGIRAGAHPKRGDQIVPAPGRRALAAVGAWPLARIDQTLRGHVTVVLGVHVHGVHRVAHHGAERQPRTPPVHHRRVGLRGLPVVGEPVARAVVTALRVPLPGRLGRLGQEEGHAMLGEVSGVLQRLKLSSRVAVCRGVGRGSSLGLTGGTVLVGPLGSSPGALTVFRHLS